MPDLSRRAVLSGAATSLAAASLAACGEVPVVPGGRAAPAVGARLLPAGGQVPVVPGAEPPPAIEGFGGGGFDARFAGLYGPVTGERFPIPAVPLSRINSAYLRTRVTYLRGEAPGGSLAGPALAQDTALPPI